MRTLFTFLLVPFLAFSQADIKLNISNAILYELNLSYEHMLNDYMTVSGFGGYFYGFPDDANGTKYWYVGPEMRYYVSPRNGADRFFLGLYMRYNSGQASSSVYESGNLTGSNMYESLYTDYEEDFNALAIGFMLGSKWVTKQGFVFGFFGGFGRNIFSNFDEYEGKGPHYQLFDPDSYYYYVERYGAISQYWDWRIGFNIGWRLGK